MDGLDVIVVGAGIGGLGAALCLHRLGHHPTIVEKTAVLRPVGAGISLWPNGIKILNHLGLGGAIAAFGGAMERMAYADHTGHPLLDFPLAALYGRVGERARPVVRAELQDLLLGEVRAALGPDRVHLGAPVATVEPAPEGATVHLVDGRHLTGDVVVAADGTHSGLRDLVVGRSTARRYVGYVNWNGLVAESADIAPVGTWLTWVGAGQRASVMPVGGGRCYWFADVPMSLEAAEKVDDDHRAELRGAFAGWARPVGDLIARMDPAGVARIPIHDLDPLPTWVRGRVALLGDAAHTMAPDLGQGGCQALEDGWVLAEQLSAPGGSIDEALARYDTIRRPHTADMVRRARNRAELIHGFDDDATRAWYRSLAADGPAGIIDGLAQSVETGPLG